MATKCRVHREGRRRKILPVNVPFTVGKFTVLINIIHIKETHFIAGLEVNIKYV